MSLKKGYSEFHVEGIVGCPDHQPRNDPRLLERRAKNKRAIGGVYGNSSLYATEYTPHVRAMLRQECRNALNQGPVPLFERLPIEPHAVKVCERIWMSDLYTATDGEVLRALKITHVVAIYGREETRPLYPIGFKTEDGESLLFMCILWDEKEKLCVGPQVLTNTHRWIAEALWGNNPTINKSSGEFRQANVLIHSLRGCNRAAMVALAMLAPSMEANILHASYQKLLEVRPSVSLTEAMNAGLDTFWTTYALKEGAKTGMPGLSLDDVFNATFPVQNRGKVPRMGDTKQPHEWWNGFGLPSSGAITRDGSLTYSAVFETPKANRVMKEEVKERVRDDEGGENEVEGEQDDGTEVADPRDAGNALLADLEHEETLEAIDVGQTLTGRGDSSYSNHSSAYSPYPSFSYPPADIVQWKGRYEARVTALRYCCLHLPRGFLGLVRREHFVAASSFDETEP